MWQTTSYFCNAVFASKGTEVIQTKSKAILSRLSQVIKSQTNCKPGKSALNVEYFSWDEKCLSNEMLKEITLYHFKEIIIKKKWLNPGTANKNEDNLNFKLLTAINVQEKKI